jgi:Ca2+-transporting ATPase
VPPEQLLAAVLTYRGIYEIVPVLGALALWSLFEGVLAFAASAGVYFFAIGGGYDEATVRTMTFVAIVSVVFSLILANRTFSASLSRSVLSPNIALAAVASFVCLVLALTLLVEPVRALFRFGPLDVKQIAIAAAAGVICLLVLDGLKFLLGRRSRR